MARIDFDLESFRHQVEELTSVTEEIRERAERIPDIVSSIAGLFREEACVKYRDLTGEWTSEMLEICGKLETLAGTFQHVIHECERPEGPVRNEKRLRII